MADTEKYLAQKALNGRGRLTKWYAVLSWIKVVCTPLDVASVLAIMRTKCLGSDKPWN